MKTSNVSIFLLLFSGVVLAREYDFDPTMLSGDARKTDMSMFNRGEQPPGTYLVDIYVNGSHVDSRSVAFFKGKDGLQPCLKVADLAQYGVMVEKYPALSGAEQCARLSVIPQASSEYQFNEQRLNLNIPQANMRPKLTGIAPQRLWDDGVPAVLLNYRANTNRTEYSGDSNSNNTSSYIQLNPGANLGAWRLRNQSNWQKQSNDSGHWQTVYTYAERGLNEIKSRLTLGDRSTPGDVFDDVPFRGGMIGSDDNMVPSSQRTYAPVIRGIARTQARIEVKQNGYTIYSDTVPPGPFALSDLSTQGASSGDLQVTVRESDGSVQNFTVPYQTPAIALHEGYLSYNLMAGQYRPAASDVDKKAVGQATVMYGLPWNMTIYSGFQGADHFQSAALGLGVSMGDWGALSVDTIGSHGQRQNHDTENGAAWRVRYSKDVTATNTTMTMTSYQYASKGYNTLSDVLDSWHKDGSDSDEWYDGSSDRQKSMSSVTLSQSLGMYGYLNLNGSRTDYWNRSGHDNAFDVSYATTINGISVSLGWTQNQQVNEDGDQRTDRQTSFWVSVPLDRLVGSDVSATYQLLSAAHGSDTNEFGLNGKAFDRRLAWDVRQQETSGEGSSGDSSSARVTWYGGYGQFGGNYRYSPNLRQMGADVEGGVVAYPGGVTFGQPLSDTVALVEAPGAAGVGVGGWPGVKTDFRGYTTQSYLRPYQMNQISLNAVDMPEDAEVDVTDKNVVPTQGAVIPAKFATRIGGRALMSLRDTRGSDIPFGAVVTVEGQDVGAGIVGSNGQVYLTGLPEKGTMLVRWSGGQCHVSYRLPENKGQAGMYSMTNVCR